MRPCTGRQLSVIIQRSKMSESEQNKGKLVVVSGPSGVGKSTICKEVVKRLENAWLSVSMTTRPKSDSEVDGRDYWFVSKDEFQDRIRRGGFLEYAEVFGNLYGTPKDKVDEAISEGKIVILEIDVQGALQVKKIYDEVVTIFIVPPTPGILEQRLNHRARDDEETTRKRLSNVSDEIAAAWQHYDRMVINEDLEQAISEVIQIIHT